MPPILIGKLIKESVEEPTKLEAFRTKIELNQHKKQVIEDIATSMLANNTPIVRIQ